MIASLWAALPLTAVAGMAISAGLGWYFSDRSIKPWPFKNPYRDLYGTYDLFNHARERVRDMDGRIVLVKWTLTVSPRPFLCPRVTIEMTGNSLYQARYRGDLFMNHPYAFIRARRIGDHGRRHDFMALTLRIGDRVSDRFAAIAFMTGFREPEVPASCVHVLSRPGVLTDDEVRSILGDADSLWFDDYDTRLDAALRGKATESNPRT